jgi:hypothetical protein
MGTQQLLLILVGVIVVGLTIFAGFSVAKNYTETSNRDQLITTLNDLALLANQHYKKPVAQGGGGGVYTGFTIPRQFRTTPTGNFSATVRANRVDFTATGKEIGRNGRTVVRVTARVEPNRTRLTVTN